MPITGLLADTNGPRLSLYTGAGRCATVDIGPVSLIFSHEECIGAMLPGCGLVHNADFIDFSRTTSKHATAFGLKDRPAVPGDRFSRLVALALTGAPSETMARAWLEARDEA